MAERENENKGMGPAQRGLPKPCPRCGGAGKVNWLEGEDVKEKQCPTCHGRKVLTDDGHYFIK